MDDAVIAFDVGRDHVGVVDLHAAVGMNVQRLAFNGLDVVKFSDVCGRHVAGDDVIGQDFLELWKIGE